MQHLPTLLFPSAMLLVPSTIVERTSIKSPENRGPLSETESTFFPSFFFFLSKERKRGRLSTKPVYLLLASIDRCETRERRNFYLHRRERERYTFFLLSSILDTCAQGKGGRKKIGKAAASQKKPGEPDKKSFEARISEEEEGRGEEKSLRWGEMPRLKGCEKRRRRRRLHLTHLYVYLNS